ncbi:retention module-containing protein, partial [Aeromonas cavernicola]
MSANSITLQQAVTITQLTGELYLVNADGSRTQLAEGDVVPQGAVIATQGGGSFMGQGELFTLPPADDARLVGEPDDEGVALAQLQTGDLPDEISALQQAILGGVDPTQTFEAAAAGGAPAAGGGIGGVVGSSGNGGFVTIDRTGNATIAEASFDTTYNAVMAAPLRAQPSEEEPRLFSETTSANLALSAAKEVNEGGEITFVATLDRAVVGEDMVITLSNGAIITIPVGQTSGSVTVPAPADDPYLDQAQVNVTVTGTLGGGFEQVVTGPGTTTQVNDTLDPTTVTLIAPTEVNEGGTITYSAVVNNPPQSDLVLTLSNGATLTILAGQLSGSVTIDAPSDDVYRDDSSLTVEIVTSQGGNYEQLNIGNSVTTTITDTLDTTTVTLSSTTNGQTVVEGGSIIYTASVSSPVTGSPLVITLTDGTRITIPVGSSSANSEPVPVRGDDAYRQGDTAVSVNIDDARGGNYEKIAINGTVSHTVVDDNDAPTLTLSGSKEVVEGQSATYTLTISEAPKTDMTVRVVIGHKTTDSGDVEAQELTLVIKAGQNSVTFPVQTLDDQLTERPEQYTVTVVGTVGGGYERAPTLPSITTTIVDDRNTSPGGNPEVDE